MQLMTDDRWLWEFLLRQYLSFSIYAIASSSRALYYTLVHRLIRCKTFCQSTLFSSLTAVILAAPRWWHDADGQQDCNQYSLNRFKSACHSSTENTITRSVLCICHDLVLCPFLCHIHTAVQSWGQTSAHACRKKLAHRCLQKKCWIGAVIWWGGIVCRGTQVTCRAPMSSCFEKG